MTQTPISAYEATFNMLYFARMLDKIHKLEHGVLRKDFHAHIGKGLDGLCAGYLRVPYADIVKRTLDGGTPEEILKWCFAQGRELNEADITIWNHFASKLGWKDHVTESLIERKAESGLSDRDEIETMLDYFEYDEGRK